MHVIALFRVDRDWTQRQLLRFYNWEAWPTEAAIAWSAFLFSPRLHEPLFAAFKGDFLNTAQHYRDLQGRDHQYASLLTYAALEIPGTFTRTELASATRALPAEGLEQASKTLSQALRGAGDRSADYWTNRISPYLNRVWPKTLEVRTPKIAENFAILCIVAGERFPQALAELANWLMPLTRPQFTVHLLHESGLCDHFPAEALKLLGVLVTDEAEWPPSELPQCLAAIEAARTDLVGDPIFQRLTRYVEHSR
jgi:hypothetical protein